MLDGDDVKADNHLVKEVGQERQHDGVMDGRPHVGGQGEVSAVSGGPATVVGPSLITPLSGRQVVCLLLFHILMSNGVVPFH